MSSIKTLFSRISALLQIALAADKSAEAEQGSSNPSLPMQSDWVEPDEASGTTHEEPNENSGTTHEELDNRSFAISNVNLADYERIIHEACDNHSSICNKDYDIHCSVFHKACENHCGVCQSVFEHDTEICKTCGLSKNYLRIVARYHIQINPDEIGPDTFYKLEELKMNTMCPGCSQKFASSAHRSHSSIKLSHLLMEFIFLRCIEANTKSYFNKASRLRALIYPYYGCIPSSDAPHGPRKAGRKAGNQALVLIQEFKDLDAEIGEAVSAHCGYFRMVTHCVLSYGDDRIAVQRQREFIYEQFERLKTINAKIDTLMKRGEDLVHLAISALGRRDCDIDALGGGNSDHVDALGDHNDSDDVDALGDHNDSDDVKTSNLLNERSLNPCNCAGLETLNSFIQALRKYNSDSESNGCAISYNASHLVNSAGQVAIIDYRQNCASESTIVVKYFGVQSLEYEKEVKLHVFGKDFTAISHCDLLYIIGGRHNAVVLDRVECYNPRGECIMRVSPLRCPRSQCSAMFFKGKLYVVGGYNAEHLASVEVWDFSSAWEPTGSLKCARAGAALVDIGGSMVVLGGYNGKKYVREMEIFNETTGEWSVFGKLRTGRSALGAMVFDGSIYVAGGVNDRGEIQSSMESFSLDTKTWEKEESLNVQRTEPTILSFYDKNGKPYFLALGGNDSANAFVEVSEKFESYDEIGRWETISSSACQ